MKHTYLPVEAVIDSVLPTRRWWPLQDPALAGPPGIQPPVHLCGTIKPENGPQVAAPLLGTAKWLILICSADSALGLRGPPAQAHCLCLHSCKHGQHKPATMVHSNSCNNSSRFCFACIICTSTWGSVQCYPSTIPEFCRILVFWPGAALRLLPTISNYCICVCIIQIIDISNTQKLTEIMNK